MYHRSPIVVLLFLLAASAISAARAQDNIELSRELYRQAREALADGDRSEFQRLRSQLDEYPLAAYLDYEDIERRRFKARETEVRQLLNRAGQSPLQDRLLGKYLQRVGENRQWQTFLSLKPDKPRSTGLRCFFYRAQLAIGDQQTAWSGAEDLWVHGRSRPDECNPLFRAWINQGELTDDLVWQRLLATFEARQGSLMRYVASNASTELRPVAEQLMQVYHYPSRVSRFTLPAEESRSGDIVSRAYARWARSNAGEALARWLAVADQYTLSREQRVYLEANLARQNLYRRQPDSKQWLAKTLPRLMDGGLIELRLRWALAEGDWWNLLMFLEMLDPEMRSKDEWRYWEAVAVGHTGDSSRSQQMLAALAGERSFHGFRAADRLQQAYRFNEQQLATDTQLMAELESRPPVRRVTELRHHQHTSWAMSEWQWLLARSSPGEQKQLAQLASSKQWPRFSIDAANRARASDYLDLRFPMSFREVFEQNGFNGANASAVEPTELMAIARRESAFYPMARSSAGAVGLMQVMPATGRKVAKQLGYSLRGKSLAEIGSNILLGSAYYTQQLERFNNNRVLALAAYNAGPSRVERWLRTSAGNLDVDAWVDTIPFKETREYVRAVLAYNVVFQYRLKQTPELLSEQELTATY